MSTQLAILDTPFRYGDAELAMMAEHVEMRAWQDLVAAAPAWVRLATQVVAEEFDGALLLASRGIDHLWFNRVIGLGERTVATDAQVDALMNRYWSTGVSNYWVHVGPYAQPVGLGRKLQRHGLKPYRRSWVKMMRPASRATLDRATVEIRRARAADAHYVASIIGPAFDLPQIAGELFAALIGRPRWHVLVAELDGEVVAAAGMYLEGQVAYLAFAATRPEFRCRGAQRALMQARINDASDAGCHWIATETGFPLAADEPSPSYHNMLWAGFRPVAIRDNYAPEGAVWAARH